jgi:hypothetical protein
MMSILPRDANLTKGLGQGGRGLLRIAPVALVMGSRGRQNSRDCFDFPVSVGLQGFLRIYPD